MPTQTASAKVDFAQLLADRIDPPKTGVLRYRDDPAGFVEDCFTWKNGERPTAYQLANLSALVKHRRVAVRGPHGLGKTAENAWVVLWFSLTRDAEGADWKLPTTASAWRQLERFLWPEIHKWARKLKWEEIGRPPFKPTELLQREIKLRTGEAFAASVADAAKIEGAHADQILYIFDEAKTIPPEIFDAAEGAFSGDGTNNAAEAYGLASSTPGPPIGRFYDICSRKPGYEDWHARHVTLEELIAAGRTTRGWAENRARQWGDRSSVYLTRVKGEFAAEDEDSVIPLAWVEKAIERWHERDIEKDGKLTTVGVDVAESGKDKTVLALRRGLVLTELRRYSGEPSTATAGRVIGVLKGTDAEAKVDGIGIGSGVVNILREANQNVFSFIAGAGTSLLDTSGELGFADCRAGAWWNLREMLDPDNGVDVALPDDDRLIGDLTAPKWRVMSGGKIRVESKEDIRKRLSRSTDDGDAVVQAFWPGDPQPGPPATTKVHPWR